MGFVSHLLESGRSDEYRSIILSHFWWRSYQVQAWWGVASEAHKRGAVMFRASENCQPGRHVPNVLPTNLWPATLLAATEAGCLVWARSEKAPLFKAGGSVPKGSTPAARSGSR
jgi:hypothetical protein